MRRILFVASVIVALPLGAQQPARWLATWAPSPFAAAPKPPPDSVDRVPTYVDRTVRQIMRTTLGGDRMRVRFTNEYGERPLVIGAASIALRDTGAAIRAGTDKAITFGGRTSVTLRRGAVIVSDPIDMRVPSLTDIAISMWVKDTIRATTRHALGLQTNYVSSAGDFTAATSMHADTTIRQWLWLAGVDVVNARATGVIVAIGNSITDGAGSSADSNSRWPDVLARRLLTSKEPAKGVVNAGISGNGVLSPITGPSALARFDRDVLMQPGVTHVIVLEGINDLSRGAASPDPRDNVTAEDVIFGYQQLIGRAHERGLVIFGATLTPMANMTRPTTAAVDVRRRAVNEWIRTSGAFDGVIDFDAATRDPSQPDRFLPAYDSGDHLHPSDAGYKAMGQYIDLTLFRRTVSTRQRSRRMTNAESDARSQPAPFLYVWAGDADTLDSDFLAVIDVRPGSQTYAHILSTVPVDARATGPHHTEHQLEHDRLLFANGFGAGRTFRFDLTRPNRPRLLGSFTDLGGFSFPHSFVQLEGGHLLATFQGRGPTNIPPGGLVELDRQGRLVRATSARAEAIDSLQMRPYSLAVLPVIDRVVSTSTDMLADFGAHLQVWRLSDLALLQTIELPTTKAGDGHSHDASATAKGEDHHLFPGEPRVMSDGRTVLLATFTCGFYRVTGIDGPTPQVDFIRAFGGENCAVPLLVGSHWIQTVPDEHALVTIDVSDPTRLREVSRVVFDSTFKPHWLAFDTGGSRLVVNDGERRLYLVSLDKRTGALEIDQSFRDSKAVAGGVSFARARWPHGASGQAVPHGSVFSRP